MKLDKICRMCTSEKSRVKPIFQVQHLPEIIINIVRLEISENDGLPCNVCKQCTGILLKMKENIEHFRENERILRASISKKSQTDDGKQDVANMEVEVETIPGMSPKKESDDAKDSLSTERDPVLESAGPPTESVIVKEESNDSDNSEDEEDNLGDTNGELANVDSDSCDVEDNEFPPNARRQTRAKRKANSVKSETVSAKRTHVSRRQHRRDPNRPKLNDHKCYICKSDSMGSAKALLEHLSVHLSLMPHKCADCVMENVVLKNVRSLNVHKKMHAQPIKCEYCDRRYSDTWARDGHVKTYHMGESAPCPSVCEQCGKTCKSLSALKSHMRDHKLDVRCHQCGKVFHRYSKLREHVTRVHEKAEKYECNICNHVVHSLESYNSHLKMHNSEKTYNCDLCPMKFYTAGNLGLHKKVHAKNANYKPHKDWTSHYTVLQNPDSGKSYNCNHCGNTYTGSINTIISHVKHHFKDLQCDQCELKFTNKHKLKIHYVVHTRERNYKCEFCDKDFLYRTHMTHHIKHKHRAEEAAGGSGICTDGTLEMEFKIETTQQAI